YRNLILSADDVTTINDHNVMDIVHDVNEHFKNFTDFHHVFRARVLTSNVIEQRKIFQLFGYTFACEYQDLETTLKEQISLALEVDISKFEIKLSETVKTKFNKYGIPIFKTI